MNFNRVIKFRIWGVREKSFIGPDIYQGYQYGLETDEGVFKYPTRIHEAPEILNQEEWARRYKELKDKFYVPQQFTGLFDSEGVEIYEGDWVKHYSEGVAQVVYGRYLSCGGIAHCGFYLDFASKCVPLDGTLEVVGNIFQNSDLLTS